MESFCSRGVTYAEESTSYCCDETFRGIMLTKRSNDIPSSEITPRDAYLNCRAFMAGATAMGVAGLLAGDWQSRTAPSCRR